MRLTAAASSLDRLVTLTAPGTPVAPVVEELATVASSLRGARAGLERAHASAALLDELDRVAGAVVVTVRQAEARLAGQPAPRAHS